MTVMIIERHPEIQVRPLSEANYEADEFQAMATFTVRRALGSHPTNFFHILTFFDI